MPRLLTPFLLLSLLLAVPAFAYSVKNGQITDDKNVSLQLRGLSWFGFETNIHTAHGLWTRRHVEVMEQMRAAGFNAVRLPLCPAAIRGAEVKGLDLALNPELAGKNSLQVLDTLIAAFEQHGIYVLLDHHRPDCETQSELWYTSFYSEADWIADLVSLAQRYKSRPNVLGIDLKNEPHGAATWGTGDKTTDFNLAAERASAAVLAAAPAWLIFVEGIGHSPVCTSGAAHFWGENLEPFECTPLNIPRKKLVLSPHVYGPDVAKMPYFAASNFPANMAAIWDQHFGKLALRGYAVVPGEFGGGYGHCATSEDRVWQNAFVQYLVSRGMGSAFFWSLNPNSNQTGGLLKDDWKTFWPDKLALLKFLHSNGASPLPPPLNGPVDPSACTSAKPAEATPAVTGPPPAPAPTQDLGSLALKSLPRRGDAECNAAEVSNNTGSPMRWQVHVPLTGRLTIATGASLDAAVNGQALARGVGANATLAPGERARFSYCQVPGIAAVPPASKPVAASPAAAPAPAATAAAAPAVAAAHSGQQAVSVNAGFAAEARIDNEWQQGYCSTVRIRNTGAQAAVWRVVVPLRGSLRQAWKCRYQLEGNKLSAEGEDYNRLLKPGESTDFGFCVNK